jgi:hypothetical protein
MEIELPQLIQNGGKLYHRYDSPDFVGYTESPVPKHEPFIYWKGPRIQMHVWRQILAWFGAHVDNEVQCRLYLNKRLGEWKAVVLPQEYPSGMTTKELPYHAKHKEICDAIGADWEEYGTVHHHCKSGAFQSGTDMSDEAKKHGLHITVGHLDKPKYDLHGRVSVIVPGELSPQFELIRPAIQGFYGVDWTNWFALPPEIAGVVPDGMLNDILNLYLTKPSNDAYPPEWDSCLIPKVYAPSPYPGTDYRNGYTVNGVWTPHKKETTQGSAQGSKAPVITYPHQTEFPQRNGNAVGTGNSSIDQDFLDDYEVLCRVHNATDQDVYNVLSAHKNGEAMTKTGEASLFIALQDLLIAHGVFQSQLMDWLLMVEPEEETMSDAIAQEMARFQQHQYAE